MVLTWFLVKWLQVMTHGLIFRASTSIGISLSLSSFWRLNILDMARPYFWPCKIHSIFISSQKITKFLSTSIISSVVPLHIFPSPPSTSDHTSSSLFGWLWVAPPWYTHRQVYSHWLSSNSPRHSSSWINYRFHYEVQGQVRASIYPTCSTGVFPRIKSHDTKG